MTGTQFNGFVKASAVIDAPPQRIYEILADYRTHHPQIIPKQYFTKLEVEEGGIGAGTRTSFEVNVFGTKARVRHIITEPQPGRVLVESDSTGSTVTTFVVEGLAGDQKTDLRISTEFRTQRTGLLGSIEKVFTTLLLKRIYRLELANIAAYAKANWGSIS